MIQLRDELTTMNGAKTQHELEVSELRGEVIQVRGREIVWKGISWETDEF